MSANQAELGSGTNLLTADRADVTVSLLALGLGLSLRHDTSEADAQVNASLSELTDTKTGKHYVGSASGEQGGIWGRWSEYARTKHGGNKRLKELIAADADYCNNFQYSILEVFPIKRDRYEVLEYEQLYKKKLWSIQFGLNDN